MSTPPLIKICGLKTAEEVDAAVDGGATHIGLNLYEPSPRYVEPRQAAALRRRIPPSVKVVLVIVNLQPQPTVDLIQTVQPDVVQFHGRESPEWLALLRQHTPLELWKAWGVKSADGLAAGLKYKDIAHRMLYDAPAGALPGGNGLAIDWSLIADFKHEIPWGLAGGLNPGNVAEAIRQTRAPLVDTASGVETAPGVKDPGLIRAFIEAARTA